MDDLCIFCDGPLENGHCLNPECFAYVNDPEPQVTSDYQKPPTLRERRRQMFEAEQAALVEETIEPPYEESADESFGEDFFPYNIQTDPNTGEVLHISEREPEPYEEERFVRGESLDFHRWDTTADEEEPDHSRTEKRKQKEPAQEERRKHHREDTAPKRHDKPAKREKPIFKENAWLRLYYFAIDYMKEPGRVVAAAARKRDAGIGLILILVTLCISTLGTLVVGTMYLEDIFLRWIGCGLLAPVFAYGVNILYGFLYVHLGPAARERRSDPKRGPITFRELFAAVTVPSVLPTMLLLLSCLLSPMDKSMRIFQFFALLITVAWIVSLIFSLFTVYGSGFTLWNLLLTVAFVLFTILAMRTLWVWFVMGDFRLTLHIPLSAFLEG